MGTVGAIIGWIVFGIIAGAIARLLVPGRQAMGLLATMALGIVGSFLGGFVASLMFGDRDLLSPSGWIGSILGAVVVLLLFVGLGRRSRTHV